MKGEQRTEEAGDGGNPCKSGTFFLEQKCSLPEATLATPVGTTVPATDG